MGLKITVYRNEHESREGTWYSYSTPASNKDENGKWKSKWLEVVFAKGAKGTVLENKTRIDCTDAFLGSRSYTVKGGEEVIVPQIVVMAFETVGEPQPVPADPMTGYAALSEDEMPF